jgi:predicted transcriptional regulator
MAIIPAESGYTLAMLTPAQIRAARAMLKWRQADLAAQSGIAEISVKNIEAGKTDPRASTLQAIQSALEDAGLMFLDEGQTSLDGGLGVRYRSR